MNVDLNSFSQWKGQHSIYLIKCGFGVQGIDFNGMWHASHCEQTYYASA